MTLSLYNLTKPVSWSWELYNVTTTNPTIPAHNPTPSTQVTTSISITILPMRHTAPRKAPPIPY
ncbi:hypothetical protein [Vulcanisaeta distributa]|uniref:hypothetical protein n=1 Tax=Vulcanisaeta distributa TaxID=164451 RepID=UPI0011E52399|nr:hypothetical protein [Vulcanisaeta distributa]